MDNVPQFVELSLDELPEWLPLPGAPLGVDVAWFRGTFALDELETLDVYVWRAGNGGRPPFSLTVMSGWKWTHNPAAELIARWPTLPQIWAAIDATCLPGGLYQLPAHLAGHATDLGGQVVTLVQVVQVGAVAGSAAFGRWAITNPGRLAGAVLQ